MSEESLSGALQDPRHWTSYNQAVRGRQVRSLCTDVLELAGPPEGRTAVDLGCGTGTETRALLEAGWRVVAIDSAPGTAALVSETTGGRHQQRLTLVEADVTQLTELPRNGLLFSSLTLPFLDPPRFQRVWQLVHASMSPGGWLAVSLLGDRDSWAPSPDATFLTVAGARELFRALDLVKFEEHEDDRPAYLQDSKHWHLYEVIARRPL